PGQGTVGTVVTILGTGYGYEEFVYAHFGTKQQIASILKASTNGSFTIRFTIDTQALGTTTVTAEGMNKALQKAYNTFIIKPEVWRVSPTEGVVGTLVTVWGTGYVAGETVSLDFGTKPAAATASAIIDGSFMAYFVVDTQPVGTTTVRVTSTTTDWTHYNYFKITTGIFVSPQSGSVGTTINVWGAGYKAYEQVRIGFGTNNSITTTLASNIGNINTTFTIDAQAYGPRPVTATGIESGVAAATTCSIFQHITHVLPNTGPVGCDVEVRGDGYERTDTISIEFGTTPQIVVGPASFDGTFSLRFVVDTQPYGTTSVIATGINGTKEVDDDIFFITSKVHVVSPTTGSVGTLVSVIGKGYAATETIRVTFGTTTTIASPITSIKGMFETSFTVDHQFYGTKSVIAAGLYDEINHLAENRFHIESDVPLITPTYGTVGSYITIVGTGYGANENVTIDLGKTKPIKIPAADGIGDFTIIFTIDTQIYGTKTVTVTGTATQQVVNRYYKIMPEVVRLTPSFGTVGVNVTVYMTGYDEKKQILLYFGTNVDEYNSAYNTSIDGTLTMEFVVNTQPYGSTILTGISAETQCSAYNFYDIKSNIIKIAPTTGSVGTIVTVAGNGFGANSSIRMQFGNNGTITNTTSVAEGSFTCTFTVDTQAQGTTTITAFDTNRPGANASGTFTIIANITGIVPTSGTVGSFVTVYGNGYGATENVRIIFGKNPSIATVKAAEMGTIAAVFTVDAQSYATKTVTGKGLRTNQQPSIDYFIKPHITHVLPDNGTVGTHITIRGNGYSPTAALWIDFGGRVYPYQIAATQTTTDGTWTVEFDIDTQPGGTTTIMAHDYYAVAATATFYITAKIYDVTPASGTVGTGVTIWGNGYAATDTIQVNFGTTISRSVVQTSGVIGSNETGGAGGTFTVSFTINTQVYGTTTIVAIGSILNQATNTLVILPRIIRVSPNYGTVGTFVTVSGNGYGYRERVEVNFGTTPTIAYASSTIYGSWTVVFTIDHQQLGTKTITGYGLATGISASETFIINPKVEFVLPNHGTVGSDVYVEGDGYTAYEGVRINFGTSKTVYTQADKYGSFSTTFTVDTQGWGVTTILATGTSSGTSSVNFYNIETRITQVNPTFGTVTTMITVKGNGFKINELIRIDFGNTQSITEIYADNIGSFTCVFTVNTQTYGTKTISATGVVSNQPADDFYKIIARVWEVSPNSGTVGRTVTVRGDGYCATETIGIQFGTKIDVVSQFEVPGYDLSTTETDVNGAFVVTFAIPTQPAGTSTVLARSWRANSSQQSVNYLKVVGHIVNVTPLSGPVARTQVIVNGNGFGTEELVRIDFGSTSSITLISANIHGVFNASFTVDTQPVGKTTIVATGLTSKTSDDDVFYSTTGVTSISPTTGTVGMGVYIEGTGYQGYEIVRVDFGDDKTVTTAEALENGVFTANFTTTSQAWGDVVVMAKGIVSGASGTIMFTMKENLIITPTAGTVGSMVDLTCTGYGAMDGIGEGITINFGTTRMLSGSATGHGTFSAQFIINEQPVGPTSITALGSKAGTTFTQIFTIRPEIWVSPLEGTVGTIITVYGNGYGANEDIRVDFGNTKTINATHTNIYGTFSVTFTINTQPIGPTTVTCIGSSSGTSTWAMVTIKREITGVYPTFGSVGATIMVAGTGYDAGEPIRIGFGKTGSITTTYASPMGSFSTTFTIDTQFTGTKTISAYGLQSHAEYYGYCRVMPKITLVSPSAGTIGISVYITGTGYGQGEKVKLDFGTIMSMSESNAWGVTDVGTFVGWFNADDPQTYGTTTVVVSGMTSDVATISYFFIGVKLTDVIPACGTVGQVVTVKGTGYNPSGNIHITFGKSPTAATTITDAAGSFEVPVTVDVQAFGTTTVLATGVDIGASSAFSQFFIIKSNLIYYEPREGSVGTVVTIKADGYGSSELVVIEYGMNPTLTTTYASTNGSFTHVFTIDTQPYGSHTITVKGMDSKEINSNIFKVTPRIILVSPSLGTIGTQIEVRGNGYTTNNGYDIQKKLSVYFGTNEVNYNDGNGGNTDITVWTDDLCGSFTAYFTTNVRPAGTTTILVRSKGYPGQRDTATFFIIPRIIICTPTHGTVGTTISLEGNGYYATEQVRINFGTNGTITAVTTSGITKVSGTIDCWVGGTFSVTFTIDTQPYGTTTILGTGLDSKLTAKEQIFIEPSIPFVIPGIGTVGSSVTVIGNGYGISEGIVLDFGKYMDMTRAMTDIRGSWTATFTVDTQRYGTTTIKATGIGTGVVSENTYIIKTKLSLVTPTYGTVGTLISIYSNGYGNEETINVIFGTTPSIAITQASIEGTFSTTFTIDRQQLGSTTIRVLGVSTNKEDIGYITINPAIPSVLPTTGTVGTFVTVIGDGYKATELVRVSLGNTVSISLITTDACGYFESIFTIDTQRYGTTTIIATGLESGTVSTNRLKITQEIIILSPDRGTVGTIVTLVANGYGAGEVIRVDFGTIMSITTVATNANGSFSTTFTIDTQAIGATTVLSTGLITKEQDLVYFNIRPRIRLVTPNSGSVGTTISLYGDGFGASENIGIDFGKAATIVQTSTNIHGAFSTAFTIDAQHKGTTTVLARGITSNEQAGNECRIQVHITLLSPTVGTVGIWVIVEGDGYGEAEVAAIDFGTTHSIANIETTPDGTFSVSFTVDPQVYGFTSVRAYGLTSNEEDSRKFIVTVDATTITPNSGAIGTQVMMMGAGYGASETIRISYGSTKTIATCKANEAGLFIVTFTIDTQPWDVASLGSKTVTAYGVTTAASSSLTFKLIQRILLVSPTQGSVGTVVRIWTDGYAPSEPIWNVFGSSPHGPTYYSSAAGTLTSIFTVDTQPGGTTTITAEGRFGSLGKAQNIFIIKGRVLSVNPSSGTVGTRITVNGDGYGMNEIVTVHFGFTKTIANAVSNGVGKYSTSFVVTTQPAGTTTITVIGPVSNQEASGYFKVDTGLTLITPLKGTVGTLITIEGCGYGSAENIRISLGTTPTIAIGTSSSYGSFSVTFTADTQPLGGRALSAIGKNSGMIKSGTFSIQAAVTNISPAFGTVGKIITVWGNGFAYPDGIYVKFGNGQRIPVGNTVSNGSFMVTFTIDTQVYGTKTVAVDGNATPPVEGYCKIIGDTAIVTPSVGSVGTIITIKGGGYSDTEPINVYFGTFEGTITSAYAGADGHFEIGFTINTQSCGTTTIRVNGVGESGQETFNRFFITSNVVSVMPTIGTVGSKVTVYGNGYASTETINIKLGTNNSISSCESSNFGEWTSIFTIDVQSFGTTTIVVSGTNSGQTAQNIYNIVGNLIKVQPSFGIIGTNVTVQGNGYGKSEQITVDFGTTKTIAVVTTSQYGTFSVSFTVDTQSYGRNSITATGKTTKTKASNISFWVMPRIYSVSPTIGSVGTTVTLKGDGWSVNEAVNFYFGNEFYKWTGGNNQSIGNTQTSLFGTFTGSFVVDLEPYGTKSITAKGMKTGATDIAGNEFKIIGNITRVSPSIGTVGSPVTVEGNGFDGTINISFGEYLHIDFGKVNDRIEFPSVSATLPLGTFSAVFTIDTQSYGSTTVRVTGASSGCISEKLYKIVGSIVSVTPTSGTLGSVVTITGTGFGIAENISVDFGTSPGVSPAISSNDGTWTTSFTIDTQPSGKTTILATGSLSGATATHSCYIHGKIIEVTPTNGSVGTVVTVSGVGYGINENVKIDFGNRQQIEIGQTDDNGIWTIVFTVDTQEAATKTITATGFISSEQSKGAFFITGRVTGIQPSTGPVETTVTLIGNGYKGEEEIYVRLGVGTTETIATGYAQTDGNFEIIFTIDDKPAGTCSVIAQGIESGQIDYIEFVVKYGISILSPTSGIVGTLVSIVGNGYGTPAVENVRISFGTTVTLIVLTTSGSGRFETIFTVDTQVYGTTTVIATGLSSGKVDRVYFFVTQRIHEVSPNVGTIGTFVTVTGDGYYKNEQIDVDFGTKTKIKAVVTNTGGYFEAVFTIDTQATQWSAGNPGTTAIIATGYKSKLVSADGFVIIGNVTYVTPSVGTVGTTVMISGNGFGKTELVKITFGTTSAWKVPFTTGVGSFTTSYIIDTQPAGITTFNAYGMSSGLTAFGYFNIIPDITLVSPMTGTVGQSVTVVGTGYKANETIHITFGNKPTMAICIASSPAQEKAPCGTFSVVFAVNTQVAGTTTIMTTGLTSGLKVQRIFDITCNIYSFSPTTGTIGTLVTVKGTGYGTSESIKINFGNTPSIITLTTGNQGSWTCVFTINTQVYGTKTATIIGNTSGETYDKAFFITQRIRSLTPTIGSVGALVEIVSDGYYASEQVSILFGTLPGKVAQPTTDSNGWCIATFTVTTQPYGTKTVKANGLTSWLKSQVYYYIQPKISVLSPEAGTVGLTVTVEGTGFGSDEQVSVDFGETLTIAIATTSSEGTFATSFVVDEQPTGGHDVKATGLLSGQTHTRIFSINPGISIVSPSSGTVGTLVVLEGKGYWAGEWIQVDFGRSQDVVRVETNIKGGFETSFVIDTQSFGVTTIIATGLQSDLTDTDVFTIRGHILNMTPTRGSVGSIISINGDGYGDKEWIRFYIGEQLLEDKIFTSEYGTFAGTYIINTQPYGEKVVRVYGSSTAEMTTAPFTICANVTHVLPSFGTVGSIVTIKGNGYGAGEQVFIVFGTILEPKIANTWSNYRGEFEVSYIINTQIYGTTTVDAEGVPSGERAYNYYHIRENIILVSPTVSMTGSLVTVMGNGYGLGERVRIDYGKTISITDTVSNAQGEFSVVWTVDTQKYATHTITASGLSTPTCFSSYHFIIPKIVINPTTGMLGSIITVCGTGYGTSEAVRLDFGTSAGIQYVDEASEEGSWTTTFAIDTQKCGKTMVEGVGKTYGVPASDYVWITPRVWVSPASGVVGAWITVEGSGYAVSETVQIDFGNRTNMFTVIPDISGYFARGFTIDTQVFGTTTLTATGLSSGLSNLTTVKIRGKIREVVPTTGTIGSFVTVIGDGYQSGEQVWIDFGTTMSIVDPVVDTDGVFTKIFTVDTQVYGTKTINARGTGSGETGVSRFGLVPNITAVVPPSGTTGITVTVTGNGYQANEVIQVFFGTDTESRNPYCAASNLGTFSTTFVVNVQPAGVTIIRAQGIGSGRMATSTFGISPKIVTVTPTQGTLGVIVTVKGDGFAPNEGVAIDFGTSRSITKCIADNNGEFTTTFTVNNQPYGLTTIVAIGSKTCIPAGKTVFVIRGVIHVTPANGTVGRVIGINGTGFAASTDVRVDFGLTPSITVISSDVNGAFTGVFTIDTQVYGITTVLADAADVDTDTIFIKPQVVSVTPTIGSVGTIVTIYSTGYAAGDNITVAFGTNATIQQAVASTNGSFTTSFTVDVQQYGTTTITAGGISSANNNFFITPQVVSVVPATGTVGTIVTIYSTGYAAGDNITVAFGTNATIQTAQASTQGSFTTSFTVDVQQYGTTTITAGGISSANNSFFITPQVVSVVPATGTVGTIVTIYSTGYAAGDNITVAFGTNVTIQTAQASTQGSFTTSFTVDVQVYGTTTITANGIASANNRFFITPQVVSVTPTSGSVGTIVTIYSTGYAVSDNITVAFGTNATIQTAVASTNGSFTTSFTVDVQQYGTTTITASGISIAGNSFFITPQVVSVTPTAGSVGTVVTIYSTGYAAGDNITVAFGTNDTIQTAVASTQGSFTTSFTVDVQQYGTTTITASGISIASNGFFITPQVVSVVPATGSVGTIVTIYSTGYAASDAVTVAFGTNATIGQVVASTQGSFTTSFTVDVQAYGTTTITAKGIASAGNSFFISPQVVSVTPTTGTVGTIVTIYSTGYAAGDNITVVFGTNATIQTAQAGTQGSFTTSFTVDVQQYGTTTIT
ncbi:hypothetical protein HY792_03095, partial [Candidatus Desantisbacteria bacterium]|nr:hypothetical protein [Candidatus Desantisbacteria bacterium]